MIPRNLIFFNKIVVIWMSFCIWSALFFYGKIVEESELIGLAGANYILKFLINYYYSDQSLLYLFCFCMILCLLIIIVKKLESTYTLSHIIYALLISFIYTLGKSYVKSDSMSLIIKNPEQFTVTLIALNGFFVFFYFLINLIIKFLNTLEIQTEKHQKEHNQIFKKLFDIHPVFVSFLLILALWTPYLIAYFPGILHYDGYWQLRMYYGIQEWTTHHPVFSTWLMGKIMDLGKLIGSDNLGIFFYTFPQSIIFAFSLGYTFKYLSKWNISFKYRMTILVFYGLTPLFSMFSYNEVKDSLAYITYLWVIYTIFDIIEDGILNWINVIKLFIFCILSCLSRNEMKYIFIGFIIISLMINKNIKVNYKKLCSIVFASVLLSSICTNIFISAKDIEKGSNVEALSLPLQQTARYMTYYKDEATEDELKVINKIFGTIDFEEIYQPNRSDSVKGLIGENGIEKEEFIKYINVWFKQFLKHPFCYMSATFNGIYGYFYPEKGEYYGYGYQRDNFVEGDYIFHPDIQITFLTSTTWIREILGRWGELIKTSALTSFLFHPGFYGFIYISLLFLITIYKMKNIIVLYLLPTLSLLICCLSPLNGGIRYLMPVICCLPLLIAVFIKTRKEQVET